MDGDKTLLKVNYPILFVMLLQIIFIIFGIITINNMLNKKPSVPKISIDNYSVIPETTIIGQTDKEINKTVFFSDENKSLLEGILYNIVILNTDGDNIEKEHAIIREGSVHNTYIGELDVYLLNMVIDLEEIGQSYRIAYRWTNNYPNKSVPANNPAMAFCLNKNELIYGGFVCKDEYNNYGADIVVHDLMQYCTFNNFSLKLSDTYRGDPLSITIKLPPGEKPPEDVAVQELSNYLSDLGFSLDDFEYEVVRSKPFTIDR